MPVKNDSKFCRSDIQHQTGTINNLPKNYQRTKVIYLTVECFKRL